jgi:hypothetical protein
VSRGNHHAAALARAAARKRRRQGNANRANCRAFLEADNGRSPYGQFFLDGARWFGGGFGVDY